MKKLVTIALLLVWAAALPTAAQTARIGHLSHGGSSVAALDAVADNFGLPEPRFIADSIKFLSDTTTLEYGKWNSYGYSDPTAKVRTHQFASRHQGQYKVSVKRYVSEKRMDKPEVKVLAYDTIPKPVPLPKKQKTKHKKSAFVPAAPVLPQHPGVALAVALVLILGGAGWLLGERKPQPAAI
ncbi:hypothetical protein ACFST9_07875 [Hymenobacter monticola]|uniref:Uncharacterized protein n=1 Tax=Hymenobacter monticola TaxID=1705399 RepID=A0ABY4B6Y6_9BACT|nr:hypothetical protein [Hymenobacter monticola]UOE33776.1 hypothetical protein MTP16_21975 [Hymenobacter monticola]